MSTATDFAQANYITQHDMNADNAFAFAALSQEPARSAVDTLIAEGKRDQDSFVGNVAQHNAQDAGAQGADAQRVEVQTAVLRVSGMPTRLRPAIERAMVQCISTPSEYVVPGDDPLTAQWCTRWYRDSGFNDDLATLAAFPGVELPEPRAEKCVGCRQVITGTAHELRALDAVVTTLAEEFGFSARVDAA
ncbi:hypothetical protein [Corynebacterium ammoniagenes]|uniref:Uncharacterized protein n=2 Tax=Corynebacterium ammoniagenes TaxID=1697 RepID=A0AAV5G1N0_CORAM|nr:hypothetical protein [Corynebacterium ammoniagenes]APT82213.1 hypothetical protein CAMM_04555 [Corynebacterium ammoniagenes DSM 20306]NMF31178.1 hypothetical protein [Corynebacterium ammoniagenes]GJN42044.1 hypothetical protein CAT723_05230 [Corynebacterium ammoniagenes]